MALPACQPVNHGEDRSNSGLAKPPGPFVLYVFHVDAAVVRVQEHTLRQPFQYPNLFLLQGCSVFFALSVVFADQGLSLCKPPSFIFCTKGLKQRTPLAALK